MISSFIYQKITIVPHSTERGTVVSILYGTYKFPVLPLSNFLDDFLLFEKITLIRCRGNGTEAPDVIYTFLILSQPASRASSLRSKRLLRKESMSKICLMVASSIFVNVLLAEV